MQNTATILTPCCDIGQQTNVDWNALVSLVSNETNTDVHMCCDMGQNDTIGKIELIPTFVLSTDKTNC